MTTDRDVDPSVFYEAVRGRPPSRAWLVAIAFASLACIAWLGWCAVAIACAGFESVNAKACAEAGYAYTRGVCTAPEIQLHLERESAKPERGPLLGPGGA